MLTFVQCRKPAPYECKITPRFPEAISNNSSGAAAWDIRRCTSSGDKRGVLINYGAYYGRSVCFGGFLFSFLLSMSRNASVARRHTPVAVDKAMVFRTGLGSALVFCDLCYRS